MGDETPLDKVVFGPALKVTAYGIAASLGPALRALGALYEAAAEAGKATVGDLLQRATTESADLDHIRRSTAIWGELTREEDPSLASVVLIDMGWWTKNVPKTFPVKKPVEKIGMYDAWTNSSTHVIVAESVFASSEDVDIGDEVAKILLRHESKHVVQFRGTGDRPPATYRLMADYEARAYSASAVETEKLLAQNPSWAPDLTRVIAEFKKVAANMAEASTKSKESEVRQAMIDFKRLPGDAPATPADLYVP